jgi:hypothetical protein
VLHDDDLAEVLVDRVLERGRLLKLDGPSIRTKHLADDPTLNDDQDNSERLRISGTNGSQFPEPTRENLKYFLKLSPEERQALREKYQAFRQLPPEERRELRQKLRQYLRENPEARERLRENMRRWRSLSEEQRHKLRERARERRR